MGDRAYYTFTAEQHQDLKDYTAGLRQKLITVAGEALENLASVAYSQGGYEVGPPSNTALEFEGVLMPAMRELLEAKTSAAPAGLPRPQQTPKCPRDR